MYSTMSNNVPDKMKPFGTLRDFGAGHLGHYETFLYGHRLGPFGTLRDFFRGHYKTLWKIFLRALPEIFFGRFAPSPLLESWKIVLPGALRPSPPPRWSATAVTRKQNGAQSKINSTQVTEIVDSL